MRVKQPDIGKLKADKDQKKLLKALGFKKAPDVRAAAAEALGAVGDVSVINALSSVLKNETETVEVRIVALQSLGKICTWVTKENRSIQEDSLSKSDLRAHKKEKSIVAEVVATIKKYTEKDTGEIGIVAARMLMELPETESSVFDGEVSASVFSQSFSQNNEMVSAAETDSHETAAPDHSVAPVSDQPDSEISDESETSAPEQPEPIDDEDAEVQDEVTIQEKNRKKTDILIEEPSKSEETKEEEKQKMPVTNLDKPVEIAPNTYWVGRREDTLLERNIYLRVFRNGDKTLNLLIDPGPPEDLTSLVEKLSSLIGGVRNLNVMFLNHQDPDVSYNSGHIQKLNPNCVVLCSEDSWRLVKFYGLNEKMYKPVESFKNQTATLNTGHKIRFISTPYCHFRGACMLYDEETGVLFSGDFLGGLSFKEDLYASADSWEGVATFHQIYMPSKVALHHAVTNIRNMPVLPGIIAPQHGSILTGNLVDTFLTKMDNLEVGLDLFLKEHTKKNYIAALNELLIDFSQIVDADVIPNALAAFRSDGSFPNAITTGDNGVTDIKVDAQYAVDVFLKEIRAQTPPAKLDLVDISIVKILTLWKIPLPDFFQGHTADKDDIFSF